MWIQLCQLLSENPNKITSIKVEPIIRQGLQRFTDMTGLLPCNQPLKLQRATKSSFEAKSSASLTQFTCKLNREFFRGKCKVAAGLKNQKL